MKLDAFIQYGNYTNQLQENKLFFAVFLLIKLVHTLKIFLSKTEFIRYHHLVHFDLIQIKSR